MRVTDPASGSLERALGRLTLAWTAGCLAALVLLGGAATAARAADAPVALPTAAARLEAVVAASHDDNAAALEELARAALDPDPWVRRTAIHALSERGADAQQRREAARGLLAPLGSADDATREFAAIAAGDLRARELVEPLGRLVADPNPRVAFQALTALERLGDPAALPQVTGVLGVRDDGLRHRALLTLGSLAMSGDTGGFPDDGGRARVAALDAAADAVAKIARDAATPMVLRQHAMVTLGFVPVHTARATLEALAQDKDARIAAQARLVLSGKTAEAAANSQGSNRP